MNNSIFKTGGSFDKLFDNMDRIMDSAFTNRTHDRYIQSIFDQISQWSDVGDKYAISKDMPGISREELKVEIASNVISVTGKNNTRNYQYAVTLPSDVDTDTIEASLKDGVLTLTAHKHMPAAPPKKVIEVK
jgi:HSP20 family molecular chaperone IbpA